MNSEFELIEGNILRAEPLPSGSHRNISVPIQKLVQRSKRRGVGNMPKPLAGGHELLLPHQQISGSGQDHRALRRVEPIVFPRQGQKEKDLVEEPKYLICKPEEGIGNDPSFGERPSGIYQLQPSSRNIQREAQRTSEEAERAQKPSGKGKTQSKLEQNLPTRVQDPQFGACSPGQHLQYGQNSYGIYSQREGSNEQDLSMQIIDEIQFFKSSIDVELGKFDAKLNKITSDISELKRNDKKYTEWYKLTNFKLDSITSTCDRLENKCQFPNYGIEDLSILNINDQLRILKDHVLEIIDNTNHFATHLAEGNSERQKLKNEVISNVEQIHKNYHPHIPRRSTTFTEENLSVKGRLTPFLGKNPICAKDIPKLEQWPTFSAEGEYNHIDFIRTIDMLQEGFHIPDEIIVGKLHSLFTRTAKKWY
ncbi:hypothetical protein O181_011501 [Austropuccinia psidii MF-1]|uniref:Uncharacterized protein n=1 Tax=Austropuccinia psidii MF-1 TaxID=1389203 RepID=A0A9Q3BVW4_9BASI|nr:hypothetical protein [Austropuccinia psidii MF-1]